MSVFTEFDLASYNISLCFLCASVVRHFIKKKDEPQKIRPNITEENVKPKPALPLLPTYPNPSPSNYYSFLKDELPTPKHHAHYQNREFVQK